MNIKIAILDTPTVDGRLLLPGSLSFTPDESKPVIRDAVLWGKFNNIVEQNNALFADVTPNISDGYCLT